VTRLFARPFLYAIVDAGPSRLGAVAAAVSALARGGAALVQLRAKEASDRERVLLCREAVAAARAAGIPLVVNDRPDVARIVGADGVHVGQDDVPPRDARALLGPGAIVGVSTHSLDQLRAGAREPVDYVAYGPVFATRTKANPDPVVGLDGLRQARASVDATLVAIGGITRARAAEVAGAGADGLAVISDLAGDDPEGAARAFVAALEGVR
jgi:thiamine-phosphate pyrophosphorylase